MNTIKYFSYICKGLFSKADKAASLIASEYVG